jgi:hypothetical protein
MQLMTGAEAWTARVHAEKAFLGTNAPLLEI